MRLLEVAFSANAAVSEAGDRDVSGDIDTAVDAALLDATIDADTDSEAAVEAIRTAFTAAFGASSGVKVFIDETGEPTQAQVIAALEAAISHIRTSSLFTEAYYV